MSQDKNQFISCIGGYGQDTVFVHIVPSDLTRAYVRFEVEPYLTQNEAPKFMSSGLYMVLCEKSVHYVRDGGNDYSPVEKRIVGILDSPDKDEFQCYCLEYGSDEHTSSYEERSDPFERDGNPYNHYTVENKFSLLEIRALCGLGSVKMEADLRHEVEESKKERIPYWWWHQNELIYNNKLGTSSNYNSPNTMLKSILMPVMGNMSLVVDIILEYILEFGMEQQYWVCDISNVIARCKPVLVMTSDAED